MRRPPLALLVWSMAVTVLAPALAQYPKVPADVQAAADAILNETRRLSDEAWQRALPVIEQEARQGRPYRPGAAQPSDLPQARIPAFPGAEGGGAYTPGGRGGKVHVVTSLADRGPGTLREACDQGGARIVVFNVAGIIRLKSPLIVRAPYITIAGQTAPGDGVCVAGESVWIDTHDVVIRHMRFRRGETGVGRRDDSLGGNPVGNIIVDHCSASWGLDENISMYRHMYSPPDGSQARKLPTVNITFQNCISSEALDTYNHSFGSTIGGTNSSFLRNLWANNAGRNPSVGMGGGFNFINNVVFNWVHRSMDGGDSSSRYNAINNTFKPGPATPKDSPVGHRILKPESGSRGVYGKAYVHGNRVEGHDEVTKDNWAGGVQIEDLPDAGEHRDAIRVDQPFPMPAVTILPADQAYGYVLENAGARLPVQDAVDRRIVEQVRTGRITPSPQVDPNSLYQFEYRRLGKDSYLKGIITDIRLVGGYPEYKGTPCTDTDKDGMPDAWEARHGLDPKDPSDAARDCNGDGYTNIEKYIHAIDPAKKIDWTDPNNNVDTLRRDSGRLWAGVQALASTSDPDPAYTATITGRADNIVKTLGIGEEAKRTRVRDIIAGQYRGLNAIHTRRDQEIQASVKPGQDKASAEAQVAKIREQADLQVGQLHQDFLARLSAELTPEQVDQVKDGMTYGVLPVTYKAYLDQNPNLTEVQKERIMAFLKEARELAMDGGTSQEKHQWFRKYKGKINNYLSAEGHTLK
ncbi:MAG: DUF3826 domain-containing protein [Phycisphaerae bacterium]|nr:DUF3826 domain-containing protein [Phycisphaerae bacterium]